MKITSNGYNKTKGDFKENSPKKKKKKKKRKVKKKKKKMVSAALARWRARKSCPTASIPRVSQQAFPLRPML